jgi:putative sterol carrier protein
MSTPAVDAIISKMSRAVGAHSGLGGTLKFDFGAAGSVLIDGKATPHAVCDGAGRHADTTIAIALTDFECLLRREMDSTEAYLQGKFKVEGDMSLAVKLDKLLRQVPA